MRKYLLVVILLTVFLLFSGANCTFKRGSNEVKDVDIHKGYDGLVLNFLKDAPPSKMYEQTDFKISFELKNKGTCDIGGTQGCEGYVQITGFDPSLIHGFGGFGSIGTTGAFSQQIPDLQGKSIYNLEGGYDVLAFPSSDQYAVAELPPTVDSYRPTILATTCYRYVTDATAIVCVDPDPYGVGISDKVCNLRDVTLAGGQGGPVAVTRISESMIPSRGGGPQYLQFKIFIENAGSKSKKKTSKEGTGSVGRGIVVDWKSVFYENGQGCADPDYVTIDRVGVSGELSGIDFIDCKPDTWEVKLDSSGKGFIICRALVPTGGEAYTAPLHIQLKYGYISSVSTSTEIVKIPALK